MKDCKPFTLRILQVLVAQGQVDKQAESLQTALLKIAELQRDKAALLKDKQVRILSCVLNQMCVLIKTSTDHPLLPHVPA